VKGNRKPKKLQGGEQKGGGGGEHGRRKAKNNFLISFWIKRKKSSSEWTVFVGTREEVRWGDLKTERDPLRMIYRRTSFAILKSKEPVDSVSEYRLAT